MIMKTQYQLTDYVTSRTRAITGKVIHFMKHERIAIFNNCIPAQQ